MCNAVSGLNHITLSVSDLDRSFNFYLNILGFKPLVKWDKGAYLKAGNVWLAIIVDHRVLLMKRDDYSHIAFTCTVGEYDVIVERLKAACAPEWSENTSEGASYYFEDPDRHQLEIHVGDLNTRLNEMRVNPWTELKFFDDA